jgi:transglutaminase-like putative cysteine protease
MKKIILFYLLCCNNNAFAQNYDAALISDSLKKNANTVTRMDEYIIIVKSPSRAIVKHKYAITILNDDGARFAQYDNYYNKLISLHRIDGSLYDASGKEIKSVKKKDIADFSANGDESLMTDNRYKRHNFYWTQYPYTIAYEDEQEFDGIFYLPSWQPIGSEYNSVEQSTFTVEAPSDYLLRFKQIAYSAPPIKTIEKDKIIYTWQLKNCIAVKREEYQPNWEEINPAVYVAPSQFEIDDYKGEMNSWLSFGKFIKALSIDRQQLPENVKQDVHKLVDNVPDVKDKINILYDYLQKNTRYISVQIGIGSWQPFDAKYVATKKYGDCKALSNYMVSILKEANISAKYVLVKAGDNKRGLWEDFSSNSFNHAIMCVPLQKDTVWLECTSQTNSPGYMGSFTGNRKVLLIDEDGGHVVNTPKYTAQDNLQLRKVDAVINEEGELNAKVFTHFTGIQQENAHGLMYGATADQKKRYLNSVLSLPTYSVDAYDYKETKGRIPAMDEYLSIKSPFYATITGKRLFVTPNFFNRSSSKFGEEKERKYDIKFSTSFIDVDTIQIKIPINYVVEAMPKNVSLKTAYGTYSISFSIKDNKIDVLRKNEINEGRFSKNEYEAISNYFKEIYKADRSKIVLVKGG